ncbi:MAG: DUF4124 domain-containing protein [Gammaproteobacteria bacterium]|nr:DUF4124 domain-containing protein [Gammaproteobacteria bacterium]
MKKFLAVGLGILIAAGIVVYQNPQMRAWFERKTDQVLPASATEQTLYRWRDAHGEWHVSDTPPQGIKYETVRVPTNANVIPAEQLTGKKSN